MHFAPPKPVLPPLVQRLAHALASPKKTHKGSEGPSIVFICVRPSNGQFAVEHEQTDYRYSSRHVVGSWSLHFERCEPTPPHDGSRQGRRGRSKGAALHVVLLCGARERRFDIATEAAATANGKCYRGCEASADRGRTILAFPTDDIAGRLNRGIGCICTVTELCRQQSVRSNHFCSNLQQRHHMGSRLLQMSPRP